jgi:tetratricopeptide (TPR) repeat protein
MLPVEECPHDWRRVKWEISSSLAAEDWDRARQLYNLVEAFNILEAKDLWVLRGQFNFFLALAKDEVKRPRACHWLLSVNPPGDGFGSYLTSRSCWLALVEAPEKLLQGSLNEKAQGILLDARNDLEKAFRSRTDLGSPYHLMLGTCYLALSDYARATGEYKKVLSLERKFEHIDFDVLALLLKKVRPQVGEDLVDVLKRAIKGDPTGVVWDFKPELFHVLAESCARGAKPSDAEAVYRQWAQEYPRDPRVYRHLASLLAQETKHKEAYEALRKEIELRPEAEKEPGYSIALALGGIAAEHIDLDRVTRQTLEKHPELEKLLDLLFLDIWPTYGRLSDEARGIWRFASIQTYYNPVILPTLARQYRQTGAVQFAKAVEIELRQRVFEGFKSEARGDAAIVTVAEEAKKDQNAGRFAEFLVGKGKLALGEMAFILREARLGKGELFKHFGEWTRQHFPSLDEGRLEVLKKICIPRNLETHTTALLDVKEVPNDCRGFLDALLAC